MPYSIELKKAARKQLENLSQKNQRRVAIQIDSLANNPRPPGVKKLQGTSKEDFYRVVAGPYRIIYQIEDDKLIILVIKIGHRRDVYKFLKRVVK